MDILSIIGDGIDSISIPTAAAIRPLAGSMKIRVPKKAERNPNRVPSRLFDLSKGLTVLPNFFPKIVADPSPSVRTTMET